KQILFVIALLVAIGAQSISAQTTIFTYQGKLTDTGTPQSIYQMRFELYNAVTGGTQIGATVTNPSVTVTQGVFTVSLDFGAAAFDGTNRFLEIAVRRNAGDPFITLIPRQQISSSPYATRALNAAQANVALDSNKLGGVDSSEYVTTTSVGNLFIKNNTTQQTGNFNISGNGIVGDSLGIGKTPVAGIKLDVVGNVLITEPNGVMQFGAPNSETGMSNIVGSGRADIRFNGTTLKIVAGPAGGPPSAANGIEISTSGNVGIGTTPVTGLGRLQVKGSTNNEATLFAENTAGGGNFKFGVFGRSTNGAGVFGQSSNPNGFGVYSDGFLGIRTGFLGNAGNSALCINALEQVATCSSSLRYKKDVQPFGDGLNFINLLHPIAYKWKADNMPDTGFGAEDVAKINPLFVTYNGKGEVEGVKYDRLSVVFVNAFKEQQKQIEQQQIQIESLKKLICLDHPDGDICQEKSSVKENEK
ncbi:MAG: tail fiber domain-containing protein, partial [Actinomycetota bacterium]